MHIINKLCRFDRFQLISFQTRLRKYNKSRFLRWCIQLLRNHYLIYLSTKRNSPNRINISYVIISENFEKFNSCFSQKRFSLHENIILMNVIRKYGGYQKMWLTLCTLNQLRMNSLKRLLQSLKDSNLALFRVY